MALPDCRAYELVTPGSTPFIATDGEVNGARASITGDGIAYLTRYPAEAAERSGERYLATRGSSGWAVEDVAPQASPTSSTLFNCFQAVDFSPDFSRSILSDGWNPQEEGKDGYCSESEEALAPGAPRDYGNLYLREGPGPYQLINLTPEDTAPANAILGGYTPDFQHILFRETAPLTEDAPPGKTLLYEWSGGTLYLVSVLPSGEPVSAQFVDLGGDAYNLAPVTHAISDDGERVFFYANGNLYLRKNATQAPTASGTCSLAEPENACTVQVDLKQGGTGTSGGGVFWAATADGSQVFFTDESRLTADSKAAAKAPDLYEYNVTNGLLRDRSLTGDSKSANVRGFSGVSEDGSRLYFVARGVLTGSGENGDGDVAQPFSPNLYFLDGKEISFVATLDPQDHYAWQEGANGNEPNKRPLTAATSPSGRYLTLGSIASLTGYDSTPGDPANCIAAACRQIFLLDAQEGQIECVSCGSGATVPHGDTNVPGPYIFSGKSDPAVAYFPRRVFDDGRVFFDTKNALALEDVNGAKDVYEYKEGELRLISTGTATGDSVFFDADPSGSNVFFATSQDLVPSDTNNGLSVYDARVGGGFSEPPPVPPCEGEACRGTTPAAASAAALGSLGFIGPEEGAKHPRRSRCKRGFVKRQGNCRKRSRRRAKANNPKQGRRRGATRRDAK